MIKYLGSVGTFIRLNDNENKTYDLLNVYSSSAARLLLFSAEVNNLTGVVSFDSASTSLYINGVSGSVIPNQQWAHITFSFEDKLATYDTNNFLIRFGDSASSNFNIQNTYILSHLLTEETVQYIHEDFTGSGDRVARVSDSASFSINIIDTTEQGYVSNEDGSIYQPFPGQKQFRHDVVVATADSLSQFTSASTMTIDDLYIDGYSLEEFDKVISLLDSQVYELTASSTLIPLSSSVGDIVRVVSGQRYNNLFYVNSASGFLLSQGVLKVKSILDE